MNLKRPLNVFGWFAIITLEFIGIMLFTYHWSVMVGGEGIALPDFLGKSDSYVYFDVIERNFLYGSNINHTGTYFVPLMTKVARFWGGADIVAMKSVNMIGAAVMLIAIIATAYSVRVKNAERDVVSIKLLLRMAIFPSALIAVSLPFGRDVWIYTFFCLSAFCLVNFVKDGFNILWLPFLYLAITWLIKFRGYAGLSVIVGILLYFAIKYVGRRFSKLFFIVLLIGGIGIFFVWFEFFNEWKFPIVDLSLADALNFQSGYYRNAEGEIIAQKTGGSDFMGAYNTTNFAVFLLQVIQSYAGNLVGPFPWQLTNAQSIYVFLFESAPMMYLIYRLWSKRQAFVEFLFSHNQMLALVCQAFTWWTMLALSNKNVGTGMRLKVPLFIFIWIVYYFFLESQKKKALGESDETNHNLRNV
ncbi:hypothetical protein [Weissella cibaria]|nr:hypothetical protein [Weissella cibaria]